MLNHLARGVEPGEKPARQQLSSKRKVALENTYSTSSQRLGFQEHVYQFPSSLINLYGANSHDQVSDMYRTQLPVGLIPRKGSAEISIPSAQMRSHCLHTYMIVYVM